MSQYSEYKAIKTPETEYKIKSNIKCTSKESSQNQH